MRKADRGTELDEVDAGIRYYFLDSSRPHLLSVGHANVSARSPYGAPRRAGCQRVAARCDASLRVYPGQELADRLGADMCTRRGKDIESVLCAGQFRVQHRRLRDVAHFGRESAGFLDRYDRIVLAVHHEERWRIAMYPIDWRCVGEDARVFGDRSADDELFQKPRIPDVLRHRRNTSRSGRRSVRPLRRGVNALEARLPCRVAWGQGGQRGEMPTADSPVIATKFGSPP